MIVGSGVTACIEEKKVCAGNESLMEAVGAVLSKEAKDRAEEHIAQGSTVIYVAVAKQVRTCLASPPNVSADTSVFAFFSPILSPVLTLYRTFSAIFLESYRNNIFIDIRFVY